MKFNKTFQLLIGFLNGKELVTRLKNKGINLEAD